jgi:hypothetical protein
MKFREYNTDYSGLNMAQTMCDILSFVGVLIAILGFLMRKSSEFGDIATLMILTGVVTAILLVCFKAIIKGISMGNYYKFMQIYPEQLEPLQVEKERTE